MSGRMETENKVIARLTRKLANLPPVVNDYYLNLKTTREPKTCAAYLDVVRKFTEYTTGIQNNKYFDYKDITEKEVSKFMSFISYKIVNGEKKETSFSHQKTTWSALNSFFTYLKRRRIITENPMEYIERSSKQDDVKRIEVKAEDLEKILNVIQLDIEETKNKNKGWIPVRNKAMYLLFITTGMRRSALADIDISDINFNTKQLTVIDKGHKAFHYDLDDMVIEAIKDWIIKRENRIKIGKWTDALFIGQYGARLETDKIEKIISDYSERALGYPLSPHKLRAAYCTLYYKATNDIYKVQRAVKHASVTTTQRYIVDSNNYQQEASSVILGLLH